jgi:hypothetical protein
MALSAYEEGILYRPSPERLVRRPTLTTYGWAITTTGTRRIIEPHSRPKSRRELVGSNSASPIQPKTIFKGTFPFFARPL